MNRAQFNKDFSLDFNRLFSMIDHTGNELNSRKNRFDKADLIEASIQEYSSGRLSWVDMEGHDHRCPKTGRKFEAKSQKHLLYTATGNLKPKTKIVKLSNTLSQDPNAQFASDFDFLILLDTGTHLSYSIAIISKSRLAPYLVRKLDGWVAQIPTDELEFVCTPDDIQLARDTASLSYAETKKLLQKQYVAQF
jgi:hypothetical protein